MTGSMILKSLFEVALVLGTLWAVFHEDLFVEFEERLVCKMRRRLLKVSKPQNNRNYPVIRAVDFGGKHTSN